MLRRYGSTDRVSLTISTPLLILGTLIQIENSPFDDVGLLNK